MAGPRRRNVVGAFPAGSLGTLGEAAAGGGANLDLAAQETGADTLAAAVTVLVQLSLAAQESGADTLAADVDVLVQAALAAQEVGPDVMAGTASVLVQAALQAQEGSDTAALAASVLVQADLAAQDEPDIFAGDMTVQRLANMDLAVQEGAELHELIAQLQAQVAILQAQLAAAGSAGAFGGPDPGGWDPQADRIERNNRLVLALVGSVVGGFGGEDA